MSESQIPNHIAIVMDGNGRWAKKYFLPRLAGHKKGVDALKKCVKHCVSRKIKVLTVFAFSSENWNRPAEEVSGLMDIMLKALVREVPELSRNGVQLHFVGDRSKFSDEIKSGLVSAESATKANTDLVLNICFNYGGRWDITQAANWLMRQGQEITEQNMKAALALAHVPDPDLVIRTGGEMRISNFLLWQSAYAEFYFSSALWPDFDHHELDDAISVYAKRERRFGKISEQL